MPYEQPFTHTSPNEHSADHKALSSHQPSSPLKRILVIVGIVGFIVAIIASFYWYKV